MRRRFAYKERLRLIEQWLLILLVSAHLMMARIEAGALLFVIVRRVHFSNKAFRIFSQLTGNEEKIT